MVLFWYIVEVDEDDDDEEEVEEEEGYKEFVKDKDIYRDEGPSAKDIEDRFRQRDMM